MTNCYYTQTLGGAQGEEGILLYDSGVPATANAGVISRCNGKQYKVQLLGRTLTKNNEWNNESAMDAYLTTMRKNMETLKEALQ